MMGVILMDLRTSIRAAKKVVPVLTESESSEMELPLLRSVRLEI
jgi:hypothetical protein